MTLKYYQCGRYVDAKKLSLSKFPMEGVPIKVVSERAGHSSIAMTLDKYGHVVPDMQQNAAEVIDAKLREALAEHAEN